MDARPPNAAPPGDLTQLFEEYLESLDAVTPIDVEALCARAGEHSDALRARIRAMSVLRGLSDTLAHDEPERPPDIEKLGRFVELRLLGRGGLSRVFAARDPELGRTIALKVISLDHVPLEEARKWMLQEGRSLARLAHPGVVRIFDVDNADGVPFVAMELVLGPSLAEVLTEMRARRAGADPRAADPTPAVAESATALASLGVRARLALKIAQALAYCHAQGVLHRDVKPGNVLLAGPEEPKLIDFGLAHLEAQEGSLNALTEKLIGTLGYIAPEQLEYGRTGASAASDQFSFGVLLYELLTLEHAFLRGQRSATEAAILRASPVRPRRHDPAIPADLEQICLCALGRAPADRYASMADLAADLEAFLDHHAIRARPPSPARRARLWFRRHRREVLLVGVPLVLVTAVLITLSGLDLHAKRRAIETELAEWDARIPTLADPEFGETAYRVLHEKEGESRALDSRLGAALLGSPLLAATHERLHALSKQLAAVLSAGFASHNRGDVRQSSVLDTQLITAWQGVLGLDAEYCPECPYNAADRERGRIHLVAPADGRKLVVERYEPVNHSIVPSVRVAWSNPSLLRVGSFRIGLQDESQHVLAETELTIEPGSLSAPLEMRQPPDWILPLLIEVPASTMTVVRKTSVVVPSFRILLRPLTWGDLTRPGCDGKPVMSEADVRSLNRGRTPPEDRTIIETLTCADAMCIAARLGLRLPSVSEIERAWLLAEQTNSGVERDPPSAVGEYAGGLCVGGDRPHPLHKKADEQWSLVAFSENGTFSGGNLVFRLALSGPR